MQPSVFCLTCTGRLLHRWDEGDFVMRTSLRDRCIIGFWLILFGLATVGWMAGLTWASIWLFS